MTSSRYDVIGLKGLTATFVGQDGILLKTIRLSTYFYIDFFMV
jgi:hypothetical protein